MGWLAQRRALFLFLFVPTILLLGRSDPVTTKSTITTLSWKPRAFLWQNFATESECDHVVSVATPWLRRSTVVDEDDQGDVFDDSRTSTGTFLTRYQDAVIAALEERIAMWTHLNVSNQEDPQVLRYGRGEEYRAHYDDLEEDSPRVATVLVYLSDVEAGGETVFPLGDPLSGEGLLRVVPKKGDALLFWSMDGRMQEDQYSLHAGAPVERGVKWTMTVWIHSGPFREESLAYRDD